MLRVGDTVEWEPWCYPGDVQRGTIIEVRPDGVVVEYGPWCDVMTVFAKDFDKLRKVIH